MQCCCHCLLLTKLMITCIYMLMLLPEYTNNVLVHCMQKSSHRQQEVCKKDLKQKKWIGNSCIVISLLLVHPQTHFFAPHYFFECDVMRPHKSKCRVWEWPWCGRKKIKHLWPPHCHPLVIIFFLSV